MPVKGNCSIQFTEPEDVLTAFKRSGFSTWAITQHTQFMFQYCSADKEESGRMLAQHLEAIMDSGAIYTLKVYKGNALLDERTPCNGSFNFRLADYAETSFADRRAARHGGGNNEILSRLTAIDQRLKDIEEGEDDDDEEEDQLGGIGTILNTLKDPQIMGLIQMMMNGGKKPAAIAGTPEEKNAALANALQVLQKNDAKFPEHMVKLADISESNRVTFEMLLGMLEKF